MSKTVGVVLPLFVLAAAVALVPARTVHAQTNPSYTITVQSGGRQTFGGFGASQVPESNQVPAGVRGQMADLVYRDLKSKLLRLWVDSSPSVDLASMKSTFYADYVDSGAISELSSRGVTTLLLAPARGQATPTDSLSAYAAKIAQFILEVKNERGINIKVTGIANEPQDWSPQQVADTVKLLRAELDNRGLGDVQIIAPECASGDDNCDQKLDALHRDVTAWNGLTGIASHSYNMAATDSQANRTFGKQYWMTEASDNGNEQAQDEHRAATISARFLNDMNHLVTHWVYFIGFSFSPDVATDNDNATKLMVYNQADGQIFTHLKYYYLKQLLTTFDTGAVFRRTQSTTEADMAYTYGQKPAVNAAAAVNPDRTWAISVVNDTGVCCNTEISQWAAATTYHITINVNELAGSGAKTFRLYRSQANQHFVNAGTVTMHNGSIALTVAPRELISLRANPASSPRANPASCTLAWQGAPATAWTTSRGSSPPPAAVDGTEIALADQQLDTSMPMCNLPFTGPRGGAPLLLGGGGLVVLGTLTLLLAARRARQHHSARRRAA